MDLVPLLEVVDLVLFRLFFSLAFAEVGVFVYGVCTYDVSHGFYLCSVVCLCCLLSV